MITLDGVVQGPGGPQEDPSGGFKYGGWTAPYGDEEGRKIVQKQMEPADYLLGRTTLDIWENFWPNHNDFWSSINENTKYVMSTTRDNTDWKNTVFIDSLADIQQIKNSEGLNIQVWGSSELVQFLLKNNLVDELCLKIYPVILGQGKKLFTDGLTPTGFKLTESLVTSTGVIIATYQRAGEVKVGTIGASSG